MFNGFSFLGIMHKFHTFRPIRIFFNAVIKFHHIIMWHKISPTMHAHYWNASNAVQI